MPWLELGITARALILPIETHGKLAKFDAPAGSTCWQSLDLGTSVNFRELSETKGQLTRRPNVGVRTRAQHKLNSFTSAFSTANPFLSTTRVRKLPFNFKKIYHSECFSSITLLETLELRIRQGLESLLHLGVLGVSCTSPPPLLFDRKGTKMPGRPPSKVYSPRPLDLP